MIPFEREVGMISNKGEKTRVASSIFITLAPPRRDHGPAKTPPFLPAERWAPEEEGRGPSSAPRGGSSAPPPPVVPSLSALGALQSAALPVETLGPDLQKEAAASPSSLQASSVFLKKLGQPQPASRNGWTGGRAEKEAGSAAAPVPLPLPLPPPQKTLEKCGACRALILSEIVWALGRGYHPECFTCVACGREIGSDTFAVDDDNKVHCLPDFYRKFASVCGACEQLIIPCNGRDTYKIECLGRSFHEDCYRCETCQVLLSPEPTEDGCHPLGSRLLCRACHVRQTKGRPAE
ncbi:filamin-binding LIM protein 1 [Python bivittatus]|uniref:Filamin-binding LIM protein 1 n=1 Tax=Python bivittatus TaxID=176946 RepID=A0A9F5J6D5_PYTBI|nr:filamin-binding LIM protein 1 [Python bivittatus]